ncbi:MAG: NUDIX hydrolase [Oligoflexia bacterium]
MVQVLGQKVQVWVFWQGPRGQIEVLLLKTTSERGGFWQPVTGSVEAGEGGCEAAIRELFEETGIRRVPGELHETGYEFEFQSRWGKKVREHVWVCLLEGERPAIQLEASEHVDWRWVKVRQAERVLQHETTKLALASAQESLKKVCGKKNSSSQISWD